MTLATFRHFCAAARVLDVYLELGVSIRKPTKLHPELSTAVALSLRTEDVRRPDHQHYNRTDRAFDGCQSLSAMLLRALGAEKPETHGLEFRHGLVYVCADRLEEWQREVTAYQSPVPVLAAAWMHHGLATGQELSVGMRSLSEALRYSTLPSVYDPRLHRLMQNSSGTEGRLCDLHVHINGSTEFTPVWLHSLTHTENCRQELQKAYEQQPKVRFFLRQLRTTPKILDKRMRMAATLRLWLCQLLASHSRKGGPIPNMEDVLQLLQYGVADGDIPSKHPFRHEDVPLHASDVQREGCMWLQALTLLRETDNHLLAVLMHSYMLIMHQHLRLLVQQPEQFGFDQFQHITLAGAREAAEAAHDPGFAGRFRQFRGMYGPDMAHVEARFAPKDKSEATKMLLSRIWEGHVEAAGGQDRSIAPCAHCPRVTRLLRMCDGELTCRAAVEKQEKPLSLGLVAHFIKLKDKDGDRHRSLRDRVAMQAKALIDARQELAFSNPALAKALVGKDAASNELEAPPEVFAPTFRMLNRHGLTHSTYHAGEDFEHILCGMRAVYEAVFFLDMGGGDRIGHATALGISPEFCRGKEIHCRKGQWLDSLVWLTWLMERTPSLRSYGGEAFMARNRIASLYMEIYGKACPDLPVLWRAWELRRFDLPTLERVAGVPYSCGDAEQRLIHAEKRAMSDQVFDLALQELRAYYHTVEAWSQVITLREEEQPSVSCLRAVQDAVVLELCRKNIVVEVLPTSNVRISHYNETDEHHVMRWLDPDDSRPAPQVVLGTDDPGIFSTTLRNEYAFILRRLQRLHPGDREKPYEIVNHLMENGMSYRFGQASR